MTFKTIDICGIKIGAGAGGGLVDLSRLVGDATGMRTEDRHYLSMSPDQREEDRSRHRARR